MKTGSDLPRSHALRGNERRHGIMERAVPGQQEVRHSCLTRWAHRPSGTLPENERIPAPYQRATEIEKACCAALSGLGVL